MTKEQAVFICNTIDSKNSIRKIFLFAGLNFSIRVWKTPEEDIYEQECKRVASQLRQLADDLEQPTTLTFK